MALCAVICVHDDTVFLPAVVKSLADVPVIAVISKTDWTGNEGDWKATSKLCQSFGCKTHVEAFADEDSHRQAAYDYARTLGYTYAITVDSDEVLEPALLRNLKFIAETEFADRVYITWDTYWKGTDYVIRPREPFTPCILISLERASHVTIREFEGGKELFLGEAFGIVHHLSYAGGNARILKKITTWSHRSEIVEGWLSNVWERWEVDPFLHNLHPTHPGAYQFAERVLTPPILQDVEHIAFPFPPLAFPAFPPVSVVIPVHGGQEDLDRCLASLQKCQEYVLETIVVDNGSNVIVPTSPEIVLIRNESNMGFGHASNQGAAVAKSDTILFLNSDTVVTKAGLMRLLESLATSRSIAAVGPYTNNCGHFQRIDPTYTDESGIELFAEAFASRPAHDHETDMLVGFCVAVRKSAWEEVGPFDTRFGLGTFEDNDLCYRLRRAGYRLMIASRSYIHHAGSRTMRRLATAKGPDSLDLSALLERNHKLYVAKWRDDLDSQYVNHLAGTSGAPMVFAPENQPEARRARVAPLVSRANVTLCMIVKNEERVLADCLASAKPFFKQIRIHDTGSTDRTREIVREFGVEMTEGDWPDSFAAARNESMRGATGEWIMWLDADDTISAIAGETIVNATLNATPDVIGFVVPVRFLEEAGGGTQVDHVKIFRNWPELRWEGRIHEQILGSLRAAAEARGIPNGGQIVRLPIHVLHSGYDTSPEGQERKKARDLHLLELDLKDRPEHPFVLFNFGMTHHFMGEQEKAIEWLQRCIAVSGPLESHLRKAYALLASSYKRLGQIPQAEQALAQGLAVGGDDPELLFHSAQLDAEQGRKESAIAKYEKILTLNITGIFTSLDPGILDHKTRHNLRLLRES